LKKHVKLYLDAFGFDGLSPLECEACNKYRGTDVHHIRARGMGGSKHRDTIDNLMLLCRDCHVQYGDKKQFREWLELVHKGFMEKHGI
jgi:5-methylcytosine-specific restriction endonuclease McrA